MKKLKLCNVHRLALSNEGEARKPIHIPFGTWPYDEHVSQTLDREHAEKIANELAASVAAGEPGIPVYQGHPDVPEYAGKYPDKGALGWVKKILVNEDGMDLEVEWDRDPGKGFGWFSPYWTGDDPGPDASGKRNVIVDGLTSVGLVNNPNIREFRLANEAAASSAAGVRPSYTLPQHLIDLANEYDESKHPRDEDGKWTSTGGGGSGGGGRKPWSPQKADDWSRDVIYRSNDITRDGIASRVNKAKMDLGRATTRDDDIAYRKGRRAALHRAAIAAGLRYNMKTFQYE